MVGVETLYGMVKYLDGLTPDGASGYLDAQESPGETCLAPTAFVNHTFGKADASCGGVDRCTTSRAI